MSRECESITRIVRNLPTVASAPLTVSKADGVVAIAQSFRRAKYTTPQVALLGAVKAGL